MFVSSETRFFSGKTWLIVEGDVIQDSSKFLFSVQDVC